MAAKRKGLGRGLDALLGISEKDSSYLGSPAPDEVTDSLPGSLLELPVEYLQRGRYQPRRDMHRESLEDLAKSIRVQGVMQPIVVRPLGIDRYEIIAGERRWRAAQMAELETIPVVVKDVSDEAAIAMALIENIQREDLNPVEEAQALLRLQEEFNLTHQQIADAVGKSRATVTNLIRLTTLEPPVRQMLEQGDLEMGHARALLGLEGDLQLEAAKKTVAKGHSVRQTESLVRQLQRQSNANPGVLLDRDSDPDIRQLQDRLSEQIGVPVSIQHGAGGKGKLVFRYTSLDELDGILAHIK